MTQDNAQQVQGFANLADLGPTRHTYGGLDRACDFFNVALFDGTLPRCLITMQRHKGAYGYFAPDRFGTRDGSTVADEIALNPVHFGQVTLRDTLATLVHEQVHLWQRHFGKPSRNGYHNKEWAEKMRTVGLEPSSTGQPGGKDTGQKVSHYILDGGAFAKAFAELEKQGVADLLADRWGESEAGKKTREKKNASKTAYVCPGCDLKAWAKPEASLMCGDCEEHMICEEE
jgi:hypothetical protein